MKLKKTGRWHGGFKPKTFCGGGGGSDIFWNHTILVALEGD